MLEDFRQEEIKAEAIQSEFLRQRLTLAAGLETKLKQDKQSGKWIFSAGKISGVGDSADLALTDLWENFHSTDYVRREF